MRWMGRSSQRNPGLFGSDVMTTVFTRRRLSRLALAIQAQERIAEFIEQKSGYEPRVEPTGKRQYQRITRPRVVRVKKLLSHGLEQKQIAIQLDMAHTTVNKIARGRYDHLLESD